MTYLEMVNNVLKRLRERTVSSVNESSYSSLIGALINDAKDEVENSWDWSSLRSTLTATTVPNVFSSVLTGTDNTVEIIDVINDSENIFMQKKTESEMNNFFLNQIPEEGTPRYYAFNGVNNNEEQVVDLYPIPDDEYTLRFNVIWRQPDLEADSDTTLLPVRPVLLLAYAKAIEERGEDGGIAASSAYMTANRSLNDYISIDAEKHPAELIWKEV